MTRSFTDVRYPEVLFKYRNWDDRFHRRLITRLEMFLAPPSSFNDPFDCRIQTRWELMSEEDCFRKNLEIVKAWPTTLSEIDQVNLAWKITHEKQLWHPDKVRKEDENTFNEWDRLAGLISLTASHDNILMWSHYAGSHTGICVGLRTEQLIENEAFDFIDKVVYYDDYPMISAFDDIEQRFYKKMFSKAKGWDYEEEYRITKMHVKKRIVRITENTFKSIYIGCMANNKKTEAIKSTIKDHLADVEIFKARNEEHRFRLIFERIA